MQSISRSCKNLKLCASLHVAKAPMLFSLLSKDYDPVFLLKMVLPLFCHSHSPGRATQKIEGGGGQTPRLPRRRCSVDHLEKLWTDHEGNGAEL